MNFRTQLFFSLAVIAVFTPQLSFSQKCKVKVATAQNGCPVYTEVYEYDFVEDKPEFPGGRSSLISFINSTRQYPHDAYELGIEGRVTCAFVVNADGKISNIQVLRGVESSLNDEAVRIVSMMPEWTPGKINNIAVPTRVVCCIPFRK